MQRMNQMQISLKGIARTKLYSDQMYKILACSRYHNAHDVILSSCCYTLFPLQCDSYLHTHQACFFGLFCHTLNTERVSIADDMICTSIYSCGNICLFSAELTLDFNLLYWVVWARTINANVNSWNIWLTYTYIGVLNLLKLCGLWWFTN